MSKDGHSGFIERNIARSAGAIYEHCAFDTIDCCVIGNLGFVWDGREMHIRVLCPESRPMQSSLTYEQEQERSRVRQRRQVARKRERMRLRA